jgi:hypothetical protein
VNSAGVLQHILEVVFGICTATVWRGDGGTGAIVFATIVCVLGCIGIGAFGSLWVFHLHLLRIGRGTYDWLIQRAESTPHEQAGASVPAEHTVHHASRGRKAENEVQLAPAGSISSIVEINRQQASAAAPPIQPDIEEGELSLQEEADELQAGMDALRSRKLFQQFGEQLGAIGPHALADGAGTFPSDFSVPGEELDGVQVSDTSINLSVSDSMAIVPANSSTTENEAYPPSYYESKHAESDDAS